MIYYHFTNGKLRDGRPVPAIGEWLEHTGEIVLCESGLHASAHPFDALQYAPGPHLHKVELEGGEIATYDENGNRIGSRWQEVITEGDKSVAPRRKIIATIDATDLLWRCARLYALQVIHLWDAPAVVKQFLETGDESLRDAAWAAAWDAARSARAAMAAAWAAARSATDAAWAATDAAWAAARSAARAAMAAARSAAWDAQRKLFAEEVEKEFVKQAAITEE